MRLIWSTVGRNELNTLLPPGSCHPGPCIATSVRHHQNQCLERACSLTTMGDLSRALDESVI
jgi:hypothetical protein